MKLSIVIPIMNQFQLTVECLKLIEKNSINIDEIIVIDNSDTEFAAFKGLQEIDSRLLNKLRIQYNGGKNIGVRESLNMGYKLATGDIVLYTHNDLMVHDYGFDEKIKKTFENISEAAIVGAYGAKGIGTADIYKTPYKMQQLARSMNVSNALMDKAVHGFRNLGTDYENVAVFDGMFFAVKRKFLEYVGGFSDILPSHHSYDNLICIQSLQHGFENIVIPLKVDHLGGRTDVGEDWVKGTGKTKQQIHEEAHPPLYEYGKGLLPIWIEDIYDENTGKICGYELFMNNQSVKTRIYEN